MRIDNLNIDREMQAARMIVSEGMVKVGNDQITITDPSLKKIPVGDTFTP